MQSVIGAKLLVFAGDAPIILNLQSSSYCTNHSTNEVRIVSRNSQASG